MHRDSSLSGGTALRCGSGCGLWALGVCRVQAPTQRTVHTRELASPGSGRMDGPGWA